MGPDISLGAGSLVVLLPRDSGCRWEIICTYGGCPQGTPHPAGTILAVLRQYPSTTFDHFWAAPPLILLFYLRLLPLDSFGHI